MKVLINHSEMVCNYHPLLAYYFLFIIKSNFLDIY